jgi:hypothetical protein
VTYRKHALDTKCVLWWNSTKLWRNICVPTFTSYKSPAQITSYKSPAQMPTVLHAKHPPILPPHINCTCNVLINTPTTPKLNFMPNYSIVLKLLHGNRCTYRHTSRSLQLPPTDRTNKLWGASYTKCSDSLPYKLLIWGKLYYCLLSYQKENLFYLHRLSWVSQ